MTRASRVLWGLCALTALRAFVVAGYGGAAIDLGPLHLSSQSIWRPLFLAVASGLTAWALSLPGSNVRRRGVRFATGLLFMVIGLNLLLQAQPAPPPGVNACQFDNELRDGFRFFLNCDSPEFLALGGEPSLVFTHPFRESRPLSFALPFVLAQPLRLLPTFTSIPVNPPHQTTFLAFVVVNLLAMIAALLCFTWTFEAGTGIRGGPELLFALVMLGANDISKLFMWTPHVQIYNLTIPCLAMYLSFLAIRRGSALTVAQSALAGLALGVCFMAYGGFAVPVICLAAVQLFVFRRLGQAATIAVSGLAPSLLWIGFVLLYAGVFHSHEVEVYREFVWIGDCIRAGWHECVPMATGNVLAFFNAAAPVLLIPAAGACVSRLAREIWAPSSSAGPANGSGRALAQAIFLTLTVATLFFGAMGFYTPRLIWPLVPPLLMIIVIDWQALRMAHPVLDSVPARLAVVAVCLAHVLILASRYGPYL